MKNKKVGLITYHNADNLGAVLQAYALQEVLENTFNLQTEIIDYYCDTIQEGRYASMAMSVKGIVKWLAKSVYYVIKRTGFDRFRNQYLHRSQIYHKETISACVFDYDIFITGSDQVWNLECSGWDYAYFLDFVPDDKLKYAYAASLGNYRFQAEEKHKIGELLRRLDQVSVRERSAAEHIEELGISNVAVCPDPVMLLTAAQWRSVVPKRLYKKKYILIYQIQPDVSVRRYALQYAREHNCKVIDNKKSLEFIVHNAPDDFLSWIYYSECVFTNSFHATAFSLIFGKQLGADVELRNGERNHRIMELLERCNAQRYILGNQWSPAADSHQDELNRFREEGLEYLKSIHETVNHKG